MKYFLTSLMLGSLVTVTACTPPSVKDPDSYLYSIPAGSKLVLNKAITIPANLARHYFQNGLAMRQKDIDIYYPHCSIVLNTLADKERIIKPTVFEIYKVSDERQYVQAQVHVASRIFNNTDGPTIMAYTSTYYLRSTDEPEVRSLECAQWNDPVNAEYLSINEVKKSLGDYFSLQIND